MQTRYIFINFRGAERSGGAEFQKIGGAERSLSQGWIFWYHHFFAELTKNAKTLCKLQNFAVCAYFLLNCVFAKKCKMQNARSFFCSLQAGKLIILQKVAKCKMQNRLFANCAPWDGIEILLHNRNQGCKSRGIFLWARARVEKRSQLFWEHLKISQKSRWRSKFSRENHVISGRFLKLLNRLKFDMDYFYWWFNFWIMRSCCSYLSDNYSRDGRFRSRIRFRLDLFFCFFVQKP